MKNKYDASSSKGPQPNAEGFIALSLLSEGEFFRRKATSKGTYRKLGYDPSDRKYTCRSEETGNDLYLKGKVLVFVTFEY